MGPLPILKEKQPPNFFGDENCRKDDYRMKGE